ncbi:MAG: tetratricopeptide repeat protein [Solirubrobacterales bacterium]
MAGDPGGELTACEQATALAPESAAAWSRLAHALARGDRVTDAIDAAERALELEPADEDVAALLEGLREREARVLPAA